MASMRSTLVNSRCPARSTIEQRARDIVCMHRRLFILAEELNFHCDEGTLTVRGVAPTFHLKQLLQIALKELGDDVKIANLVAVRPNTPR
jgi:hypothetical protein